MEREGRLPDAVLACVGGGSNAMGIFSGFLSDPEVRLFGVEAAGEGLNTRRHSAALLSGRAGVLHGAYTMLLDDEDGQIRPTHSVAAGLDYPAVGPEHCYLADSGRATYLSATDEEAINAFEDLARSEGIIPAMESSHALARLADVVGEVPPGGVVVVCLSGRGDKDAQSAEEFLRARANTEGAGEELGPVQALGPGGLE
jgi:tryptophan synthase beta chain